MKQETDNKIFVLYVGVQGVRLEDIPDFVQKVTKKISPTSINCEIISIPVQSPDTRIECINPEYITNSQLIKKHTNMMKKLQQELQHQLEQLKTKKNE